MATEEITAVYLGMRQDWGKTILGRAIIDGSECAVKGPPDDLVANASYRMHGKWNEYRNARTGFVERQFHFDSAARTTPADRAGIIAYILDANQKRHGIGHAKAAKAWELWGSDAVRMFREDPAAIVEHLRIPAECAQAIADWLVERRRLEQTQIDLAAMLDGRGFRKTLVPMLIRRWKARAAEKVARDPYQLMSFPGCGFRLCDNLWLSLGLPPSKLRRQAYALWYSVAEASENGGHSYLPLGAIEQSLAQLIPEPRPRIARRMAKRLRMIVEAQSATGDVLDHSGKLWLAEGKHARAEEVIAERIAGDRISLWPSVGLVEGITDHQRDELAKATSGPIGILSGGGGTGKSYAIARLLPVLIDRFGAEAIGIAAPTGKAAVRVTEYMQAQGIDRRAKTWHSLLGVDDHDADTGGWSFIHGAANPWPYNVVIGDESSMLDAGMLAHIVRAMPASCHLLLLGDTQQLPPVGVGAPLRDLIAAGVPHGELLETHRNSGGILEACQAIRERRQWSAGDNLRISGETPQMEHILDAIEEHAKHGYDRVWDIQPIVPINEKSPISREKVNEMLAHAMNPSNGRSSGGKFCAGDKVVCLQNQRYECLESDAEDDKSIDARKAYVANGEIGKVLEAYDKRWIIELSIPRRVVVVPLGLGKWDLGYCLSCHKSQGAQWPVVIVVLDEASSARRVCDRSWLYTAISRAESYCELLGRKETADSFCRRQSIEDRKTFLRQLILAKRAERELVEM